VTTSRATLQEKLLGQTPASREPVALAALIVVALVISGIAPYDRMTWWLEVGPVLIGLVLATVTFARFRLSPLLYRLLFVHALILILGGHYTYARVPIGFWVQDWLELSRNHYDRLGHLAQGFVPAILAREILLRRSPLVPGRWLFFLVTPHCSGAIQPSPFSAPRVMSGIHNGTCFWPSSAPLVLSFPWAEHTTDRSLGRRLPDRASLARGRFARTSSC
jgi:hypothetical protein